MGNCASRKRKKKNHVPIPVQPSSAVKKNVPLPPVPDFPLPIAVIKELQDVTKTTQKKPKTPSSRDVQPMPDNNNNVTTDPVPYQEDFYSVRNFKYAQMFYLVGLVILVVVMVHLVEHLTTSLFLS